jgi:cystathionine beta-lyase/cystathionine gamma-synthase
MGQDDRLETKLVHAGELQPRVEGSVSMPIFQSSTFERMPEAGYHELRYLRLNNSPNHTVLHAKLAALEGTEAALVTASGMAAISTTLLTLLRPGDHVLVQACVYGGTHALLTHELRDLGIEHTFFDAERPTSWVQLVRPNTRAVYCETITNPLLEVADLPAIARFAREQGLVSLVDNTFASPVAFRPAEHGFDLVLHSATKYLNGHSDIVAGVVAGSAERIGAIGHRLDHLGATLDPHACFLLQRGLKTLALRVRHQSATAVALAAFLEEQAPVISVRHPGLASHPDHERARALLDCFGGMLTFEVAGGANGARHLLEHLRLATDAPSLGGPETLVTCPAQTSHAGLSPDERRGLGIRDGLVRVSVGLEHVDDLRADFTQALSRL